LSLEIIIISKYVKRRLSPTATLFSVSLIWFFQLYVSLKRKDAPLPKCFTTRTTICSTSLDRNLVCYLKLHSFVSVFISAMNIHDFYQIRRQMIYYYLNRLSSENPMSLPFRLLYSLYSRIP